MLIKYSTKMIYVGLGFFLWSLNSCGTHVDDFRIKYATKLEQMLLIENQHALIRFKQASIHDDAEMYTMVEKINSALSRKNNSDLMDKHLDSLSNHPIERNLYCTILLHRFLNRQNFEESEILNDWKFLIQKHEKKLSRIAKNKLHLLISSSNEKYNIGDTVAAFFMKASEFEPARLAYSRNQPDSIYYKSPDFFKVLGIVVNKKNTANSLVFRIRILEMSESGVFNGNEKITIGYELDIEISSYGRPLGNRKDFDNWGN